MKQQVWLLTLLSATAVCLCTQCKPVTRENAEEQGNTINAVADTVNSSRTLIEAKAIAEYAQKVPNDLNNWQFSVKLFETKDRFTYRVVMQYEEVTGHDMITFPNLGKEPQPVLRKGNGNYSCIIGFNDLQGNFREYKQVTVKNEALKITTLKYYSVSK